MSLLPTRVVIDKHSGKAKTVGIDHNGAEVLSKTETHLAIKIPSRTITSGARGCGKSYYPATTRVFEIISFDGVMGIPLSGYGEVYSVKEIMSWSHGKSQK